MNAQTQATALFQKWGAPPEQAEACARDYLAVLRLLAGEAARQEQLESIDHSIKKVHQ